MADDASTAKHAAATTDRVSLAIEGGVADVRLNRPDKLNGLDDAMFSALIATGERLKTEPGLRAVVLSGEGRSFCAGLDTSNFGKMASGERSGERLAGAGRTARGANHAQNAVMVWRDVPVPVIAAVHGHALGGGFQLTLSADLRFVTPDAKLSVFEVNWGLVPDMGGIVLMRHLVRDDTARELTYSGRVFTGQEALALGLATRVCADPRGEALALARQIAARSPDAVRGAKRLFDLASNADEKTILLEETREQVALIGSPNQREAVMSQLEKRPGRFAD